MFLRRISHFAACLGMMLALLALPGRADDKNKDKGEKDAKSGHAAAAAGWQQYLHIDKAFAGTRFRYKDKKPGKVTDRDLQYKLGYKVKLDMFGNGKTYFGSRVDTGGKVDSAWAYAGAGLNKREWALNVRSLYFGQKFGKQAEFQFGGIEFDRGVGSEATYADDDSWLVGYRLTLTGWAKHAGLNRFNVTVGYLGDPKKPNVFGRLHRLNEVNYVQVLGEKKFAEHHAFSGEYNSIEKISFLRGSYCWDTIPAVIFDTLRLEAISRASDNPSFGWAGAVAKTFDPAGRFSLGVIYSSIPAAVFDFKGKQLLAVGDQIDLGRRIGPTFSVRPFRNFEISLFGSRKLDETKDVTRWRGQVAVSYDFAGLINGEHK